VKLTAIFSTSFSRNSQLITSGKSLQWQRSCSMKGRQTDVSELWFAFYTSADGPKDATLPSESRIGPIFIETANRTMKDSLRTGPVPSWMWRVCAFATLTACHCRHKLSVSTDHPRACRSHDMNEERMEMPVFHQTGPVPLRIVFLNDNAVEI
jgi:hypothetical protein